MTIRFTDFLEVFITTVLVSYLITPLLRKLAMKTGYLDHPLDNKSHAHSTPLLGGVGIYIAFIVGVLTTADINQNVPVLGLMIGSTILLMVGLIDDRIGMMPEVKLLGEFLAAMALIKSGARIEFLGNYYLNVIFTYLWIVGITNAFNLLDNMNGLSSGIAAIVGIFFGVVMAMSNQPYIAAVSFALAGACLGFLKHNFPRARIFMGDSGSLVIGFLLASIAIMGSWNTKFLTTSLAMPVVILAYPIFDTALVSILRIREGRSVFQGGKDHTSHRLALLGLRKKRAVLVIYGICFALGLSALVIQRLPLKAAVVMIALIALLMSGLGIRLAMVRSGRFGRKKKRGAVT